MVTQAVEAAEQRSRVVISVEHPANQREPVGVQSVGRDAQQAVSLAYLAGFKQPSSLDYSDHKACQVHLALSIDLGHLGRLAADESALRLPAPPGDTAHQRVQGLGFHIAEGHVVEEEEGGGALGQDVIDVQGHQVPADGLEMPQLNRNLELGANAIGAGYQHRPGFAAQLEEPRETAASLNDFRAVSTGRQTPDAFLQFIHAAQVNPGLPVGVGG